ncbi:MAG TPA: mandelate racemase/muconate lactonizing enzyme family protein [Alphaproteobacteria bacterium]|nr:mandelate racemase/muconate lactonizing enzyme family protein [Alphaproteobacteria bacterium]
MKELEIDRVQVYAVGPETERFTWATGHTSQYVTNTIARITTRGGLEGVAGAMFVTEFGFTAAVAETVRRMLPLIIGATPFDRERLWYRLQPLDLPMAPQAQSIIDIALWDLLAKHAGLPLYQVLGGPRSKIMSYASTPMLPSPAAYIEFVAQLLEQGFRAIKFHCYCEYERDMEMVRAVHSKFGGSGVRFMLDVEQRYTREQALKAARELEELGYTWFEAPLPDFDVEGYRDLKRRVSIPIIANGNWILDLRLIEHLIKSDCWTHVRVDTTVAGGVTPMQKIMGLAEAHGMNVEIQSWGYTLTQAANLHVMLAHKNCDFFEQPVPYEPFEFGSLDVIRTDADGYVHAPAGAGLGIRTDWEAVEKTAFLTYEERMGLQTRGSML